MFDVVIPQRGLINLPTWELQQIAIANTAQVTKAGGFLSLQEGTGQGWEQVNQVRERFGLEPPPVPSSPGFGEESCGRLSSSITWSSR